MNALPALSAIATDAVRRQFAETPEPERSLRPAVPSWRVALAGALERAAQAVAPPTHRPAH